MDDSGKMRIGEINEKEKARRGLILYFVLLIPASGGIEYAIFRLGGSIGHHVALVGALMWMPAMASFIARLILREGVHDVSFGLGRNPLTWISIAFLFPLMVACVAYPLAWTAGLARFSPPLLSGLGMAASPPVVRFLVLLLLGAIINPLFGSLFTAGEEIGWRGFMLTRLIKANAPQPVLLSGVIWGLWHFPLILSGQYASGSSPGQSAIVFLVVIIALGFISALVRLGSGSIWPAVALHSSWNAIIQSVFDPSTQGGLIWIGESGILVAAAVAILAWFFTRNRLAALMDYGYSSL